MKHQSTSQLISDQPGPDSSPKRTGSDSSAIKQQSSSQLSSDRHRPRAATHTGTDSSPPRPQSTGKLASHRPASSAPADAGSPQLTRQRKDSASSDISEAGSEASDQ